MRQSYTVASKLFQIIAVVIIVMTVFVAWDSGKAKAGDRDDAKALVGTWKTTIFGNDSFMFLKGDGTSYDGADGKWTVKDGKLVITKLLTESKLDFTLSPDSDTLTIGLNTYKRLKK